jgi:hypothetical protein
LAGLSRDPKDCSVKDDHRLWGVAENLVDSRQSEASIYEIDEHHVPWT